MSLPAQNVQAQAFGFATCSGESTYSAVQNRIYGDCKCYEHDQMRAMFYWWATDVMERTPQEGGDCNCGKCVTDEFACSVITLMGPGCIVCGCGSESDRPISCEIAYDQTVYQVADADQELVLPNVAGRTTLIISNATPVTNNWSAHVGEVATDDGTGIFTYYAPAVGDVILDAGTSTYYVAYAGGVGPLFPPIDGSLVFLNLTLFTRFPGVTAQYNRNVAVETSPDGVTWTVVYFGPESALIAGYTAVVSDSPTLTRSTYYYGEEDFCSYAYADGSIPPFVAPPCGILVYDITPDSTCATDNWTIDVNFTQIDGWNIGEITPVVNGVVGTPVGITLGTTTFGPYIMGDLVTFSIVNNLDGACDITTQVYADPRVGEQDFTVLRAVDADEYAALSADGNDYYIVSDLNGSADPWAANVGSIWLGASSTYQAVANLEIVYASNPGGALGFWQDDSGTPLQMFPQPTYTLNTVTLVPMATLPTLPPFTQAWATLFMSAQCPSSSVQVYTGTPGGFTSPNPFTNPSCAWASVTGFAVYSDGCAVRVPAITDTYTPEGDPDPDFLGYGVDSIVRAIADSGLGDGSFYIAGGFTTYRPSGVINPGVTNIPANRIARLDTNGGLDAAFNAQVMNPSGLDAGAIAVEIDSQNRVYVGGNFQTYNGAQAKALVRLLPTGAIDPSFNQGTGFAGAVNFVTDITVQNDDKVVVTGLFTSYNGTTANRIIRLNTDGSVDNTFMYDGVGTGQSGGFNSTAGRSAMGIGDGTIIVNSPSTNEFSTYTTGAGPATTVLNASLGADKTLIRINPNGSLNSVIAQGSQFEDGGASPTTNEFAVQPDGKIICIGKFTGYDGNTVNCIVRMDALGTIDAAFLANTGTGVDPTLYEILGVDLMPNGWIMVGANAAADFNGTPTKGLIRLTEDGAIEPLWNIGVGFNSSVYVVCVDTFGDIIVGGAFTQLDGTVYNRVVKLT